jgi:hypothetical protein
MGRRVHAGITVITERLCFQTTNLVGLAIIMNEVINSFSISKILHLADEAMMHDESTTLLPSVTDLTRVSVPSHYVGFSKGREILLNITFGYNLRYQIRTTTYYLGVDGLQQPFCGNQLLRPKALWRCGSMGAKVRQISHREVVGACVKEISDLD